MSMQIDPYVVLGVEPGATLEVIRDAYRRKAKVYHPDAGGEEWAFRIVVQAYELLGSERVAHATLAGAAHHAGPPPQAPPDPTWVPPPEAPADGDAPRAEANETIRPGVEDVALDPDRVVAVEKLWVRYESNRPWLLQNILSEDRFLGCALNITWPDRKEGEAVRAALDPEAIVRELSEVFEELKALSHVEAANFQADDDAFSGWLNYPNMNLASLAFTQLHDALRTHGFSIRSWTRDLLIPRDRQ